MDIIIPPIIIKKEVDKQEIRNLCALWNASEPEVIMNCLFIVSFLNKLREQGTEVNFTYEGKKMKLDLTRLNKIK